MHINERGRVCLRTLVDRKRKRYDNAVDVVVRLHDPTDPSTEGTAPPRSAHVQLGDVLRTLDLAEVEGEFRQHDNVVTVMMKLSAQGSAQALQQYDRGVFLWRGAPHMAKRNFGVPLGCPLPRI